jgi:hypothetical protein
LPKGELILEIKDKSQTKQKPKLLAQGRAAIRMKHYGRRTEEAYVGWIRRFVLFHGKRQPNPEKIPLNILINIRILAKEYLMFRLEFEPNNDAQPQGCSSVNCPAYKNMTKNYNFHSTLFDGLWTF